MLKKSDNIVNVYNDKKIFCPSDKDGSWNKHPKVYINRKGICPYCGKNFLSNNLENNE